VDGLARMQSSRRRLGRRRLSKRDAQDGQPLDRLMQLLDGIDIDAFSHAMGPGIRMESSYGLMVPESKASLDWPDRQATWTK
jgi:hypothetical protein